MKFKIWLENAITAYHVTPTKNLNKILSSGLMPNIGPRSSKIETKPSIFLFKSIEDVENAVMNWLGDEFNEEEPLSLLKITVPVNSLISTTSYEYETYDPIPPSMITVLNKDI